MQSTMTPARLMRQNERHRGSGGRSKENRVQGFRPAFMDLATRVVYASRFTDGHPAPFHLLDGLPGELVTGRDTRGRVTAVKGSVVAGFVRGGRFYSREEAANCTRVAPLRQAGPIGTAAEAACLSAAGQRGCA